MQKANGLVWVGMLAFMFPAGALGKQPLRWHPTLESAKREAAETNRLVLIHFWADWCHACRRMDREVLAQPDVAAAVQANYSAVKINADFFPAQGKQYGVTALPTDVIITPQGQLIERFQGVAPAPRFVARLNQVAANVGRASPGRYGQVSSGPLPAMAGQAAPPRRAQPQQPIIPTQYGQHPPPAAPNASAPPPKAGPTLQPSSDRSPPGNPPLGLDGYCPVQLSDNAVWTLGNSVWGARHHGRTYLFAGAEEQRRFLAQPDRYAPVLSGNDVVLALEQRVTVPGRREHGVFFDSRVYLFANEASLDKFSKSPAQYANQVLQATRPGVSRELGLR